MRHERWKPKRIWINTFVNLSFCDGSQPAEKECLAEIVKSRAARSWTARGFASAYQTRTAAPVRAAGSGAAVRKVHHLNHDVLWVTWCSKVDCSLLSACHNDMYGPDCRLGCKCQNGGVCNRFSGCHCPTGWRGQHCEKSGGCCERLWYSLGSTLSSLPHCAWTGCSHIHVHSHCHYCSCSSLPIMSTCTFNVCVS